MAWLGNFASFALVALGLYVFDANPRALLFAFILSTVAQAFQIKLFLLLGRSPRYRELVASRTRAPTTAEEKWARDYVNLQNAATSFAGVLFLIAGLSLFAFLLAHVDQHRELAFHLPTFRRELTLAIGLTMIYVVESLLLRETAMDLSASEALNLHYGSQRITVLALAILFAGAGIAFLQSSGREVSAWVIMGPLLVLKHGFEAMVRRRD